MKKRTTATKDRNRGQIIEPLQQPTKLRLSFKVDYSVNSVVIMQNLTLLPSFQIGFVVIELF